MSDEKDEKLENEAETPENEGAPASPNTGRLVRVEKDGALVVLPLLLGSAFFLTYRFVPRGEQDWRGAAVGAVS